MLHSRRVVQRRRSFNSKWSKGVDELQILVKICNLKETSNIDELQTSTNPPTQS